MGCDYYVVKELEIYYADTFTVIEINRERGYIYENMTDSDEEDYESWIKRKYLYVSYQPKILFENDKWKSEYIQQKYEKLIKNVIENNKLIKVIKKEARFRRY